eukprot:g34698.t1
MMFALVLSLVVEILEAQRIYEVLASDRRPGEGTYPLSQIIKMLCDNFQSGEEYSEDVYALDSPVLWNERNINGRIFELYQGLWCNLYSVAIWCPATGWRVANSMEDCVKSWLEPMSSVHSAAACVHPRNLRQWNRFLASMSGSATYRWNIRQRSKLVPLVFPYCGQESVDRDTDSGDWEE